MVDTFSLNANEFDFVKPFGDAWEQTLCKVTEAFVGLFAPVESNSVATSRGEIYLEALSGLDSTGGVIIDVIEWDDKCEGISCVIRVTLETLPGNGIGLTESE